MTALCEVQDDSLSQLKGLFLPTDLDRSWSKVWRTLLESQAFRHEITIRVRQTLYHYRAPRQWQDDVVQETFLVLARWLTCSPTLNADPARLDETFEAWLGVIVRNASRLAFRTIDDLYSQELSLDDDYDPPLPEDVATVEHYLEIDLLLTRLDPATRTLLQLYDRGQPVPEIAASMGMPTQEAYRRMQKGVCHLRRILKVESRIRKKSRRLTHPGPGSADTRRSAPRRAHRSNS